MSHSIRFTPDDLKHVAKIQLDRGGISFPDAIRVAVEECASRSPVLAIKPMMAPPKNQKEFLKALGKYGDDLVYVAETGLPLNQPDASPADQKELNIARGNFRAIHARTEKMQLELEVFQRMVVQLPTCQIEKLSAAARLLEADHNRRMKLLAGPLDEFKRSIHEPWTRDLSGPLLEWLTAVGVLPPKAD